MKKALDSIKDHFKIPRGALKHCLLYGPRHSDIYPRRYSVNQEGALKASSPSHVDGEAYDSRVDVSDGENVSMLQEKLWVTNKLVKGEGACAWWKMLRPPLLRIELALHRCIKRSQEPGIVKTWRP
jgi:hypothetical protein